MANICDNTFYAYSKNRKNIEVIINFFRNWFYSEIDDSNTSIDIYFQSKWVFPEEHMINLYESIPDKSDIYMRCLSAEYGLMYHALWECDEFGWEEC